MTSEPLTTATVGLARSRQRRHVTVRDLTASHPVAAFLALTFLIAYPLMSLIALAVHGVIPGAGLLDRLPIPADEVAGLLLTLAALLPSALYVTWASEGRPGMIRLLRRVTRVRFALRWWLLVVTALPASTIAVGLLLGDSLRTIDPVGLLVDQLPLLLVNLALINLWEETSWAGVLQTRLERRHNLFVAAALTAVPFGFAHWPLALIEPSASTSSVLVALPAYVLLGLFVRPLFGLTLRATGDSLLAVALLHSIFNRTQNSNGIGASLLDGQGHRLGLLITLVVLSGLLAAVLGSRIRRAYRLRLDATVGAADSPL